MSIKIHHGAPGSYKTSGALSDDLIPNISKGRFIVTNVRGLTRERIIKNLVDCSESLEVINYDTSTQAGRDKFKFWFQWVPLGALIIIDEAQMVFPKSWTKNELSHLKIDGTEDINHENYGRPHDFATAFEMHRHYNWDFILTTPNIKLIRDDIRLCADGAFHHRDLGSVGINGRYKESYHSATDSASLSNYISVVTKKVNKDVFKLYGSTVTQDHSFTTAGIKIWKDPKILFSFGVLALSLYYTLSFWFGSDILNKTTSAVDKVNIPLSSPVIPLDTKKSVSYINENGIVYIDSLASDNDDKNDVVAHPYDTFDIYIDAVITTDKKTLALFSIIKDEYVFHINAQDLILSGYSLTYKSSCFIRLKYENHIENIFCRGKNNKSLNTNQLANVSREESNSEHKLVTSSPSSAVTASFKKNDSKELLSSFR